jgi:hypothetical protein
MSNRNVGKKQLWLLRGQSALMTDALVAGESIEARITAWLLWKHGPEAVADRSFHHLHLVGFLSLLQFAEEMPFLLTNQHPV